MHDRTVLLVEDNEDNRTIYATMLRYCGYTVIEACDGEAGVDAAIRSRPDLILMDISLPAMDGWEATRRIKAHTTTRGIPVVALTAHALADDRARAVDAGCDGYLPKPIEPRAVVREVDRLLDARLTIER